MVDLLKEACNVILELSPQCEDMAVRNRKDTRYEASSLDSVEQRERRKNESACYEEKGIEKLRGINCPLVRPS